jgi:hypothetical protein
MSRGNESSISIPSTASKISVARSAVNKRRTPSPLGMINGLARRSASGPRADLHAASVELRNYRCHATMDSLGMYLWRLPHPGLQSFCWSYACNQVVDSHSTDWKPTTPTWLVLLLSRFRGWHLENPAVENKLGQKTWAHQLRNLLTRIGIRGREARLQSQNADCGKWHRCSYQRLRRPRSRRPAAP